MKTKNSLEKHLLRQKAKELSRQRRELKRASDRVQYIEDTAPRYITCQK